MKTVAFYTLGCKVNQYETEAIAESFKSMGYIINKFDEKSDVYVVNSCSVTAMADRKARTLISKARKQNPGAIIVLCGCYSQTNGEVKNINDADIIIGNRNKCDLPNIIKNYEGEKYYNVPDIMEVKKFEETPVSGHEGKTRAFMKIQDGCDNYCAYCIIPYARGHIRSREMTSIKNEAETLIKNGYREIVLTGIHITSYGKDSGGVTLLDVLKMLHGVEGLMRIRLGSLEYNDALINVAENAKDLPKLCNHFHVSLQSGCEATLKRMGRKYTAAEYEKGINKLREAFPGAAVTTDIMVGFPGETEEEFEESLNFAKKLKFAKMHIFPYSIRKGTRAAKMDGQLTLNEKKLRVEKLEVIDKENIEKFSESMVGSVQEVLFEQKKNGYYVGHTKNYLEVFVKSEKDLCKKIIKIKITEFKQGKLYGEEVQ